MYSAYKLNKQIDNSQPWHTPFPIWNQSIVPCLVLTVASWPAYRFLRRQVRWSGTYISLGIFKLVVNQMVKGFGIVNKGEVDVFLESAFIFMIQWMLPIWSFIPLLFSKTRLYIWKFLVHVLLKPSLKDFEHDLASMWNECNCVIIWTFFGTGIKAELFQSCGHCWVFHICWHTECSTLTASSFRIWNSSAGIPSPPLALFILMLPKAHTPGYLALSEFSRIWL